MVLVTATEQRAGDAVTMSTSRVDIADFFLKPKRRPGRPRKKPPTPPPAPPEEPLEVVLEEPSEAKVQASRKRPGGHTNWHEGEDKDKMDNAVNSWLDGTAAKRGLKMRAWALVCEVPYGTLSGRCTANAAKRVALDCKRPGKPKLLNDTKIEVVADCIIRADRAMNLQSARF